MLDQAERARASRLSRPRDRVAFVSTRATLRRVIGKYLGRPPAQIRFARTRFGKLQIAEPCGPDTFDFSVSHSDDLSLVAVGPGRIGIDIEAIRPLDDLMAIAAKVFDPQVLSCLRTLPPQEVEPFFFHCWTAGEAVAKATGLGIAGLGGRFPVKLDGRTPCPGVADSSFRPSGGRWRLAELDVDPQYAAALAYEVGPDGVLPPIELSMHRAHASEATR